MGDLTALVSGVARIDAGGCPSPFIAESLYPYTGGFKGSRYCEPNILSTNTSASYCCLPCPIVDWIYEDSFQDLSRGSLWVHVGGFILCSFLLLSMIVLPKESRRAYLNIVLLVGVLLFDVGFIINLGRKPPQCYDAVTQTDQDTNFSCAISGAFSAFGAMWLCVWILVRAVFMHLQICWDITPHGRSYIVANVVAFSVTIALTTAALIRDKVSERWGYYCLVNAGSLATYWGWLLAFAGLSFLLQLATFGYVLKVYVLKALLGGSKTNTSQSGSFMGSTTSRNARATARRVRTVLLLQWRSLAIVSVAIFTVSFVCIVFIVNTVKFTGDAVANDSQALVPWILCLVTSQEKNACLQYIGPNVVPGDLIIGTLFLMSFVGVWGFALLCRVDIFRGWYDIMREPLWRRRRGSRSTTGSGSFVGGFPQKMTVQDGKLTQQRTLSLDEEEDEIPPQGHRLEPIPDEELGPLQRNPVDAEKFHAK